MGSKVFEKYLAYLTIMINIKKLYDDGFIDESDYSKLESMYALKYGQQHEEQERRGPEEIDRKDRWARRGARRACSLSRSADHWREPIKNWREPMKRKT